MLFLFIYYFIIIFLTQAEFSLLGHLVGLFFTHAGYSFLLTTQQTR